MSPYKSFTGKTPNFSKITIFGCQASMIIPADLQKKADKLDSKTETQIILGNCEAPLFRLFHIDRQEHILARHVHSGRSVFPRHEIDSDYEKDGSDSDVDYNDIPELDYSDSDTSDTEYDVLSSTASEGKLSES